MPRDLVDKARRKTATVPAISAIADFLTSRSSPDSAVIKLRLKPYSAFFAPLQTAVCLVSLRFSHHSWQTAAQAIRNINRTIAAEQSIYDLFGKDYEIFAQPCDGVLLLILNKIW